MDTENVNDYHETNNLIERITNLKKTVTKSMDATYSQHNYKTVKMLKKVELEVSESNITVPTIDFSLFAVKNDTSKENELIKKICEQTALIHMLNKRAKCPINSIIDEI